MNVVEESSLQIVLAQALWQCLYEGLVVVHSDHKHHNRSWIKDGTTPLSFFHPRFFSSPGAFDIAPFDVMVKAQSRLPLTLGRGEGQTCEISVQAQYLNYFILTWCFRELAAGPIKFCMPEQLFVSELIHVPSTNI